MEISLKVLMGRGYDATPSIVLTINDAIYVINAPPHFYRAFCENLFLTENIKYIFLTSIEPHSIGGLPSFFADAFRLAPLTFKFLGPSNLFEYFYQHKEVVSFEYPFGEIHSKLHEPQIHVHPIHMSRTISYIIDIHLHSEQLSEERMNKLHLKHGPWIKELQESGRLIFQDGSIKKEDIFIIHDKHYKLLILDIRELDDIKHIPKPDKLHEFDFVLHFTPPHILQHETYLAAFPHEKSHLNYCFLKDQLVLFSLSKLFYDTYSNKNPEILPHLPNGHTTPHLPANFISLTSKDEIYHFLHLKHDPSSFLALHEDSYLNVELPTFSSFCFTFLGTSNCHPTPTRSTPGYLLQTKHGFIVIDCSNGFVQQLKRRFGPKTSKHILKHIKCVWISHRHFDHMSGLLDLLLKRAKILHKSKHEKHTLPIYCEPLINQLLEPIIQLYENHYKVSFHYQFHERSNPISIGDVTIESFPVTHCEQSMGCLISLENGEKIAYTGDMLNDGKFVNAVKHCDYLICESTYPKPIEKCTLHNHMCMEGANNLKDTLGAKYLFMVHFTPDYPIAEMIPISQTSAFAFDYLSFTNNNVDEVFSIINS